MSDELLPIAAGTPAYRNLCVALLIAGLATFALLYSVQPLLPVFADTYRIGAGEASLAFSIASGPMAFALLFAGIISDRLGRRPVMVFSLFAASLLSLAASLLPGWHLFLLMRFLTGIALAGIPAVAMAYVAEEVDAGSIGAAMGLYIAGSAIGGMAGRLGLSLVADLIGWRYALACMNLISLVGAVIFYRVAPHSRSFVARRHSFGSMAGSFKRLAKDAALPWLYAEGFLLMGVFITIYNYAGFHLREAPYLLGQAAVGAIFLLYILGSYSASWFGRLADRRGRRTVFWIPIAALLAGSVLTIVSPLPLIIVGIGIVTVGFFGAHSIASSWVGRRAQADRAQGSALYLFFYYLGSSILGSVGGIAWSHAGWFGIVAFTGVLAIGALLIAGRLATIPPLTGKAAV